ncbi:DUF748 domain-containing protein [Ferrimonas lipolytica]|uniref:DUF748 domain-containing protein n=1 Tax=Ferrimonas lipolytica TaxID=2724191 RepID=A0A6H1UG64_9GAMM|nr:DUF748 domain-containing protein [Ferrimonas lipolytica]QIZ77619.1 DUF748 domain-containing protein [Ferrimonas lipolytica]
MLKQWWEKAWVRRVSYALIALALYCLTLGWGLPSLAERQLPKWIAQNTNGSLSIANISFNPLTWELKVDQVALNDEASIQVVALEQGVVNIEPWRSLFTLSGTFSEITLYEPALDLVNRDASLNISDIFAPLSSDTPALEPEAEPQQEAQPIPLTIDRFALQRGAVSYQVDDHKPLKFEQLSLAGEQLDFAHDGNKIALALVGPGGGELDLKLDSQLTPLNVQAELALRKVQLQPFWQFLQLPLAFDLDQGALALTTQISVTEQGNGISAHISNSNVDITQVALSHQQQPLLSIDSLNVSELELRWPEQQLAIAGVTLQGGHGHAQLDQDGLNWATLFQPIDNGDDNAAPATTDEPTEPSEPWVVTLDKAAIEQWQFNLTDTTPETAVQWQVLLNSFSAAPLGSDLSKPIALALATTINEQGRFDFSGNLQPDALTLDAQLALQQFNLLDTIPYWQQQVAIKLLSGQAGFDGTLQLKGTEPLDVSFDGRTEISNFVTQDPNGQRDLLKWKSFALEQLSVATAPMAISIDTVKAVAPYARIIIDEDGSTNLSQLSSNDSAAQTDDAVVETAQTDVATNEPAAESTALPLQLEIGQVVITQGSAFFADNSLTPKFATGIEQIEGRIGTLSTDFDKPAEVDIAGKVDRYAPMSLQGELQPFGADRELDLALNFDNIELTSLNPYSGTYAGYFIDQGQLNLALNYQMEGNKLNGNNKVVLNQLKLGQRSESEQATSLPVSLALALMQDSNGVIDLELDISGEVDDPSFAVGPLVMKALTNVITKAVTAPFSLLGSLLEGDPPAQFVQFAAGEIEVTEQAQADLKRLSKALEQRPGLNLALLGSISPNADKRALAERRLSEQLGFEVSDLSSDSDWQRLVRLAQTQLGKETVTVLQQQQPEPAQWQPLLLEKMVEAQAVSDEALSKLALNRAANTKQVLVEVVGLPPERVFVRESRVNLDTRGSRVNLELSAGS